MKTLQANMKTT